MQTIAFDHFPLRTFDKIRYSDTDRQGHVNNAVFSTYLETGRVELLYKAELALLSTSASFVIAALNLNFIKEILWPGQVDIGTGILKIGTSSIKIYQQLFQNGHCVASAETVIVQVDNSSGQSLPLSEEAKAQLSKWLLD
ncbi:MAG: acyl-CoA thioesterase [Saprospiraceae bacterium]|nr:acyl-CoA thioesterase [Saprospiraceae bacterium]